LGQKDDGMMQDEAKPIFSTPRAWATSWFNDGLAEEMLVCARYQKLALIESCFL
jgi:hypothetical protein